MNKYVSTKKLIFTTLLMVFLSCLILGYSVLGTKKSEALSAVPTTTTVGALYDFDNYCYDVANLNDLSERILRVMGGTGNSLNDLITYAKNTASEDGKPIAGNSVITVQYGRYRFSNKSSYKNLAWMPVYISRSTTGDAILTLYLAATDTANKSTSQQEAGYFAHDGSYSTSTATEAPSNSYGTSFIRAVSLGNLGQYADYVNPDNSGHDTSYNKLYNATVKESNYNKFSDFIKGTDFTGVLYNDIATPAEIKWQANESYASYINEGIYAGYCWPNESYGTPSAGTYYKETYFDYVKNNKSNYDIWKNDKVWLPSLTEVGTGDITDQGNGTLDTTNGIWKLTASKRSNTINSWLRTANTIVDRTSGHSTYSMFAMDKDGKLTTADVNATAGIRPAIHLNLSKITDKTTAPVNLPEEVTSVYTGDFQSMLSVPENQRRWYSAEDMTVYFYIDKDCTRGTVPLNSGEYYMMVELKSTSKRTFFGESATVRLKSAKFIVEKAKIGVKWIYEDDTSQISPPKDVELVGEFYQRDINANNIPTLGMKYSNVTNAGIQNSPVWPDKIGWYKAVAYIVDDDIHNYNYELTSEFEYKDKNGNTVKGDKLESHQFEVLQKKIDQPYFKRNGATSLELGYKGRQYVQIVNVSSYVSVNIKAVANGQTQAESDAKSQAALDKIVDMGIVDGVQTFAVEAVAQYTFTVTLNDVVNTVWADSGTDTSSRLLSLTIQKAEITVAFDGLPSSWESARNVEFSITAVGVYNTGEDSNVGFNVSYYVAGTYAPINVPYENGKYVFKSNSLVVGEYYIYVVMSGTSAYTSNYEMKNAATQKFTVVQTVANFTPQQVFWKYKVGDVQPELSYAYDEHNSASKALELNYVPGGYYEFSLSLTEARLKASYLKAEYSGDTYVSDAGLHSVTVVISAYDKNVDFRAQTYTIYFRIAASKYDLSNIKWDYTNPFTYSGNEYKVNIDPETLPAGLTVSYNTGGVATNAATNAGDYVTAVSFIVSDEYAKNYVVPNVLDANSYINNGSFSFTCNWTIQKENIIANWNTESSSSNIFFVPKLEVGDNLVNYSFEHREGGNWVACSSLTSTSSNETYRVTATLKPENANNYTLSGNNTCEFEVAAGQYAVTINVEVNGVRRGDGDQLGYTGSGFNVVPVIESSGVTIGSYTVDYYTVVSGVRGAKLSSSPVDAGSYLAVINVTFGGSGAGFQNETQFNFEVVKADIDLSALKLVYTHGGDSITATWDTDQQKWVDASGKEVNFAFEYDGTRHEIQLSGETSVPGLTVNSFTGNSGTNANNYTAFIDYEVSDNYNSPELSKTLNWKINQADISFENVKWGYIDSDGVEYEFGSEGAQFTFMRDDDKNSVKYTVGLINIPSYLKSYFRYTTTSYTDHDFGSKSGNSFSAIGEYHTEVSVVGTYTDPTGNRKTFRDTDFPENISKSLDWNIIERELTVPEYNGSWLVFDDKVYDLIELCGMPKDELNYFNVEITFMDKNNTIYNNYGGYEGVPFAAHDAGIYTISFYELLIKFNGTDYDDKVEYVWGQVEIEVDKANLEVAWDKNGAIPVAKVKGVYVTGMLGTMYYPIKENGRGASVSIEYIKTTNGEVTFEAEPYVTKDYANNLSFVMANSEVPIYTFWYEQYTHDTNSVALDVPVIEKPKVEYTGSPITFAISGWDFEYKNYLYIVEGVEGLTKTDVGVYHVTVSFIKYDKTTGAGNAYWKGTDDDRSSQVLTFEITAPTRIPLDKPEFNKYNDTYTGAKIEFRITNWVLLQAYVDYEVFYKGNTLGKNITLDFKDAGIYTIVFTFKNGSAGYWVGDPDLREYTAQVQITDPNSNEQEIMYPAFQVSTKEYTGAALEFQIDKWNEYYNMHIEIVSVSGGATYTGGTFRATDRREYEVVVRTKIPGEIFANGTNEYRLKFTIAASSSGENTFNRSEIVLIKVSNTEYRIDNWSSFGNNLEITCNSADVTISGGTVRATKAGTYTIYVNIKADSKAKWDDGKTDPVELTFTVSDSGSDTPPSGPQVLDPPSLKDFGQKEFTGDNVPFEIQNWEVLKEFVDIVVYDENGNPVVVGEDALNEHMSVGSYTYYLRLKDPNKAVWADGSTTDKQFKLEIVPATVTVTTGEDGRPHATNSKGEDVNLNDYLEPKYFDPETGEEVPTDKLEDGKAYDVRYTIKNEEEFRKNVENYSEVKEILENTTYNFTYVKPASSVNMLMIITIVEVVILVVLVIATIVVLAAKRHDYDDDDADNYDDDDD